MTYVEHPHERARLNALADELELANRTLPARIEARCVELGPEMLRCMERARDADDRQG